MSHQYRLEKTLVGLGLPVVGVSGGPQPDGTIIPWRVDWTPGVTPTAGQIVQKDAAIAAFDPSPAAHQAWLNDQQPERKGIRAAAAQAIADNDTYLALSTPTNAQVVAQVRRLTQQMMAVIRRLVQID